MGDLKKILLLFFLICFFVYLPLKMDVGFADAKKQEGKPNVVNNITKIYNNIRGGIRDFLGGAKKKVDEVTNAVLESKISQAIKQTLLPPDYNKCKMDPTCYFVAWVKRMLVQFLRGICQYFIDVITISQEELFGEETGGVFVRYQSIVQNLAWSFLALFLTFHSVRILALYTVEINPTEVKWLIQRLFVTSVLIYIEPKLVGLLVELNELLVNAFLEPYKTSLGTILFAILITYGVNFFPVVNVVTSLPLAIISGLLFIIILQFIIRYAEIALLMILGPFAIATNINKEYNLFPVWWRHLLATIFTQAVQVLLILIWIEVVSKAVFMLMFYRLILSVGFLIVIARTPGFLKQWMYSTGAASGVMSGVRAGVRTVTSVAKTAIAFIKPF